VQRLSEKRRVILGGLAGSCLLAALGLNAADKSEYKVGDRLPQKPAAGASGYKETPWDALMPADWNPAKDFQALDLSSLSDSDPRAAKALEQLRAALDNAPVVDALNGQRIRIAGFTVPLESARGQISEFLLVPYFGACIHTPPPPANQIIHVKPVKPFKSEQAIEAVWVSGTIETVRSETGLGHAGYRMRAETIVPYTR
jgi:uncharacterized protein